MEGLKIYLTDFVFISDIYMNGMFGLWNLGFLDILQQAEQKERHNRKLTPPCSCSGEVYVKGLEYSI